ncbi:hypothetical protein VIBC2010_00794 [Vibrio caribbeanicus ATCC BAA-2122]|uniref:Uncharacterized protein n=1 Tax=Vibrio caribbeanicus ATCC BAA-2122 TaxID=796620 RepID=E3BGI0_9VIBR|nr:hypothetical protein VIBC2010_00794 [Vibrio caribbeanicus ATCC BAA-2122]
MVAKLKSSGHIPKGGQHVFGQKLVSQFAVFGLVDIRKSMGKDLLT